MRLLVVGGTKFVGRSVVETALARGHEVTTFSRGETNRGLWDGRGEMLYGDRDGGLGVLAGRSWDAAIDTSAYFPRLVRELGDVVGDSVGHYVFVSTVSVYSDLSQPLTESSPLATLEDETVENLGANYENYGGLKVLCEREAERAFRGRTAIVRAGLIVGPHDQTDRFTYWPRRLARGGEILAPAPAERQVQFVDVRDLADWLVRLAEERRTGIFNATNHGVTWDNLLAGADVTWVDNEFLLEHDVGEWVELPLWIGSPEAAGMHQVDASAAVAAGLTFRPVEETVRDTAEWDATRGEYEPKAGLEPEKERELLAAWRATRPETAQSGRPSA